MDMVLVSEIRLGKRPIGRLKNAQDDNIKIDLKDYDDIRIIFSIRYNNNGMRIHMTLTVSLNSGS
jgi:hypothetical protein